MDVIFFSLVIVGCLLFLKLVILVWVYICRAKRLQNRQQQQQQQQTQRNDASLYPASPYNASSGFVNFEEVPQPVMTVTPGETPQGLLPQMMPPPYSDLHDKPPAYTEIYKQEPVQQGADAGTECVDPSRDEASAVVPASLPPPPAQRSALPPTPTTPPQGTLEEEEAQHATVSPGGGIAVV